MFQDIPTAYARRCISIAKQTDTLRLALTPIVEIEDWEHNCKYLDWLSEIEAFLEMIIEQEKHRTQFTT